jgi:calcium-dependent protein kinase
LIDFGFAVDKNDKLYKLHGIKSTEFGTPIYMAPEKLYNKPLEEKSDMWSVGVMAYFMLAGYPPFWANDESKLFEKIKTCDYDFFDEWNRLSGNARDFVSKLLEPNLKLRLSAQDALNHKWLRQEVMKTPIKAGVISLLLKHQKLSDF